MDKSFVWAGHDVNRRLGDQHYLVVGASGSGKSTLLNQLTEPIVSDPGVRAIVYDPKQELVPFLFGLRGFDNKDRRVSSSVKILHPFDKRGVAWDMADDIDDPISARQLATILIPDSNGSSDGFYIDAIRDVMSAVFLAFVECVPNAKSWTFRDILLALLYEPYLDTILNLKKTRSGAAFPILSRIRDSYFGENTDPRTKANIRAGLNAKLAIYEPVAAAWTESESENEFGGKFSLRQWMAEQPSEANPGSVLVLGNDEAAREALDPINRAIFKRATELVLARRERTVEERESGTNQIWFVLDEVREAGKLDGLGRLLTKGRSKNVCVAMGFQDIDGMRDVYGKEVANEICAQFNNLAVLRVNSSDTAQWASDQFGKRIETSRNASTTMSTAEQGGFTTNQGRAEEERPFLHTDAFLYGTNAAVAKGVVGYRKGPDIDVSGLSREQAIARFRFREQEEVQRIPAERLARELAVECETEDAKHLMSLVSAHLPKPPSSQYLLPWNQADFERLGLPGTPPDWGATGTNVPESPIDLSNSPTTFEGMIRGLRKLAENRE